MSIVLKKTQTLNFLTIAVWKLFSPLMQEITSELMF